MENSIIQELNAEADRIIGNIADRHFVAGEIPAMIRAIVQTVHQVASFRDTICL